MKNLYLFENFKEILRFFENFIEILAKFREKFRKLSKYGLVGGFGAEPPEARENIKKLVQKSMETAKF